MSGFDTPRSDPTRLRTMRLRRDLEQARKELDAARADADCLRRQLSEERALHDAARAEAKAATDRFNENLKEGLDLIAENERMRAALVDIESNWDHEHPSKGSIAEEYPHDPTQCRCCIARNGLHVE